VIAKARCDFAELRLGRVGVARLLETQRPKRRQRRFPGEISVTFYDLLRRGAINEVVVERTAFSAERIGIARPLAEIEPGAPGIIQENAIASCAVDGEKKRNRLV